jgi:hypothetical protein
MRISVKALVAVAGVATVLGAGGADSSATTPNWQAEFARDVASFRKVARSHVGLSKTSPIFEVQFNAFSIYAGELKAESRQLELLKPPRQCAEVQDTSVRLLRRASQVSKGLGEAKNLTPQEFEHGSLELRRLPSRLAGAADEAARC